MVDVRSSQALKASGFGWNSNTLAQVTTVVWFKSEQEVAILVGDDEVMPTDGQRMQNVDSNGIGLVLNLLNGFTEGRVSLQKVDE